MMEYESVRWLWREVWPNLLADFLFTVPVAVGLFVLARNVIERRRRALFSFFGINANQEKLGLCIYVSRLEVHEGGSTGVDGALHGGFRGPALMQLEVKGANVICAEFKERLLDALPTFLKNQLVHASPYLANVQPTIDVSPPQLASILNETTKRAVIILGSDVYNHDVRRVYGSGKSFVRFVGEQSGSPFDASKKLDEQPTFEVDRDGVRIRIPARELNEREIGTIQRVTFDGRRLLLCAGISSSSTGGAAEYVGQHWMELHRRFQDKDFLVVLQFPGQKADQMWVRPVELRDFAKSQDVRLTP
jgi:hypothetical protein